MRQAKEKDTEVITNMLKAAAVWLHEKGISQWGYLLSGGEDEEIEADILAGKTYIIETAKAEPVASFNFSNQQNEWDLEMWGKRFDHAYYVHRLVVNQKHRHQQIGSKLLNWIDENHTIQEGFIRLDCVGNNPVLNSFYRNTGFRFVGSVGAGEDKFSLYEKAFTPTA